MYHVTHIAAEKFITKSYYSNVSIDDTSYASILQSSYKHTGSTMHRDTMDRGDAYIITL